MPQVQYFTKENDALREANASLDYPRLFLNFLKKYSQGKQFNA